VHELSVAEQDIILFGRSIGSSPSCFIAKERPNVGAMILLSPFKSLREVAKDHVGKILSYILAERYRNIELIEYCKCPVIIIHGMNDSLIDVSHSYALKSHCGSETCKLITPDHMDHNQFKLQEDIIHPVKSFLKESGVRLHKIQDETKDFALHKELFLVSRVIYDYDQRLLDQKMRQFRQQYQNASEKVEKEMKKNREKQMQVQLTQDQINSKHTVLTRNSAQKEKMLATGTSTKARQRSQKTSKREGSLNIIMDKDDKYYGDRLNQNDSKAKQT
jgi:hypothetical protein